MAEGVYNVSHVVKILTIGQCKLQNPKFAQLWEWARGMRDEERDGQSKKRPASNQQKAPNVDSAPREVPSAERNASEKEGTPMLKKSRSEKNVSREIVSQKAAPVQDTKRDKEPEKATPLKEPNRMFPVVGERLVFKTFQSLIDHEEKNEIVEGPRKSDNSGKKFRGAQWMAFTSPDLQKKCQNVLNKWKDDWAKNAETIYRSLYPPTERFPFPFEAVSVRHYREFESYRAGGQQLVEWREHLKAGLDGVLYAADGVLKHATYPQRLYCAALLFDISAFDRIWDDWFKLEANQGEKPEEVTARLVKRLVEESYCEDRGTPEGGNILHALCWHRPEPGTNSLFVQCDLVTEPPSHTAACDLLGRVLQLVPFASPLLNSTTVIGGWTPLMISVRSGSLCHSLRLLRAGARVDLSNERAETALYVAAERADIVRLRWLIMHGADIASSKVSSEPTVKPYCGTLVDGVLQMKSPENVIYLARMLDSMESRCDRWFGAMAASNNLTLVKAVGRAHSYRPLDFFSMPKKGRPRFDPWQVSFQSDFGDVKLSTKDTFVVLVFTAVGFTYDRSKKEDKPKLVLRRADETARAMRLLSITLNEMDMALASDLNTVDMWVCTAESIRENGGSNNMSVSFTSPDSTQMSTKLFLLFRPYIVTASAPAAERPKSAADSEDSK